MSLRLESKTAICINKLKLLDLSFISSEDTRHFNCSGYNENCPERRAYCPNYEIPITRGSLYCKLQTSRS